MLVAAGLLTVPVVVVPSPHLMVAVKSAGVLLAALVLTKLATRPLNDWPSVAARGRLDEVDRQHVALGDAAATRIFWSNAAKPAMRSLAAPRAS